MTVAIVQARMGSTRLPGKVLRTLGNRPALEHVIRRLRAARTLDAIVVATSELPADQPIADAAERLGVTVFRGSEGDVLARCAGAARAAGADVVVRVTADCPLLDPSVVDRVVAARERTGADYASNTLERSFPRGLDVEACTARALFAADNEAADAHEREHVTPFLYRRPERFRLESVQRDGLDLAEHRWTLDTPEDAAFFEALFAVLGDRLDVDFGAAYVADFLISRPDVRAINAAVEQRT